MDDKRISDALQQVMREFPFPGYVSPEKKSYTEIARTALRHLKPGARILDFGSGPCDKTAVLRYLGFECSAYDDLNDVWHQIPGNREKIMAFVAQCGIDLRRAADGPFPFDPESFDMVMLHDVLEHVHDSPRSLLNDLLSLAKPDGLLFITVPSAVNIRKRINVLFGRTNLPRFDTYYWHPDPWRGHIREYVKDDLRKLAEYLNLDVLELRTCDHMLRVMPKAYRPAYLFVTKFFPGWKDSWLLVARKRAEWVSRKELPKEELQRILGKITSYDYEAGG